MDPLTQKDYPLAITCFTEAICLNPKDAKAFYNRGLAWLGKSKYAKAIADYSEAIRLNPRYVKAYRDRGYTASTTGAYDKAIADFTEGRPQNDDITFVVVEKSH